MDYEIAEDSIRNRLADKLAEGIDAKVMEETEAEVERPITAPRATVCFFSTDYDQSRSTGEISQEETVTFVIMITARRRRSGKGVYDIYNQCRAALLGWTPEGCTHKIQFKQFKIELNEGGWFTYGLYLETRGMIVEDITEIEELEASMPTFQEITFDETITAQAT